MNHKYIIALFLVLAGALTAKAQEVTVKGKVTDPTGLPIIGAAVMEKGTSKGVVTDNDGTYAIGVSSSNAVLVATSLGYDQVEVKASDAAVIVMSETAQDLEGVVVIGYGTVARKDLTGSVSSVDVTSIEDVPVASFTEAMSGRVAGVQVSSTDGQPGVEQQIIIRGNNSLTQSNSPLYVVDGFPVEDFDASSLGINDIESVNVLKDASSTAIYGARAANGVIVVTTKKGKIGKPVVTFKTSCGISGISNKIDVMSPYEFVKYNYELRPGLTAEKYFSDGRSLESYRDIAGVDWFEKIRKRVPVTQNYELSVRGGNDQTRYSFSGSFYNTDGIISHTGYNRYQGRINLDQRIGKYVKTGVSAHFSRKTEWGQTAAEGATDYNITTYQLFNALAYRPVSYDPEADLENSLVDEDVTDINDVRFNPVITNDNEYRKMFTTNTLANLYLEVRPIDGLVLLTTGTMSLRDRKQEAFHNSKTLRGSNLNPRNNRGQWGSVNDYRREIWSSETTLTYDKCIKTRHNINVVAGASFQKGKTVGRGFTAANVPNEELGIDGLDEGVLVNSISESTAYTMASFFGRINYNYDSRYLFTATWRADGSSRFSKKNRWAYFPSAAIAWNLTEEKFMRPVTFMSTGKIRLSWGQTGNNRVTDYAYISSLKTPISVSYSFQNKTPLQGLLKENIGNKDLKWETTEQWDLGIDLGFFRDRILFTADLYHKVTRDLLLNAELPYTSGFETAYKNVGSVMNRGMEFTLSTVNIKRRYFTWTTDFNIAFNQNRILSLEDNKQNLYSFVTFESNYNNEPLYLTQVGKSTGMFYGYVYDGVYQYDDFNVSASGVYVLKSEVPSNGNTRGSIQPGDIKYKDLNGDGTVDSYDRTIIGRGLPIHTGGFTNTFKWKGLTISAFFQWSYGNHILNANRLIFEGNTTVLTFVNQFRSYEDRWTPENQTNKNFRAGGHGPLGRYSSRVLEDGSYLRLKNLTIGYEFSSIPALKRAGIRSLNLYLTGHNLVTFTKYSGYDPEVSTRNSILTPGFDFSSYPMARSVVLGLNIVFKSK